MALIVTLFRSKGFMGIVINQDRLLYKNLYGDKVKYFLLKIQLIKYELYAYKLKGLVMSRLEKFICFVWLKAIRLTFTCF